MRTTSGGTVSRFKVVLVLLVLAGIVGGAYFLATWDFPVPTQRVEKPIPDEQMPR